MANPQIPDGLLVLVHPFSSGYGHVATGEAYTWAPADVIWTERGWTFLTACYLPRKVHDDVLLWMCWCPCRHSQGQDLLVDAMPRSYKLLEREYGWVLFRCHQHTLRRITKAPISKIIIKRYPSFFSLVLSFNLAQSKVRIHLLCTTRFSWYCVIFSICFAGELQSLWAKYIYSSPTLSWRCKF
jgi:hypothetical protein